jgi:hypothetical protein
MIGFGGDGVWVSSGGRMKELGSESGLGVTALPFGRVGSGGCELCVRRRCNGNDVARGRGWYSYMKGRAFGFVLWRTRRAASWRSFCSGHGGFG